MFKQIDRIKFPKYSNARVNMMPFVFGDNESVPEFLRPYLPIINMCELETGSVSYLTIDESFVMKDSTQRRGGVHVEAPKLNAWGGGSWGGISKGIYMASNDGLTNIYNEIQEERNTHGGCIPITHPEKMLKDTLYWMTDKTPHEALPSEHDHYRQFIRIVSEDISVWYTKHNTPNPLGVMPTCPITETNKFGDHK